MKRTTIISLLLFLSCRLLAQTSLFAVKHYSAANGLPSGITTDVSWDHNGFMWISTLKGLARFDGIWMHPFTRDDDPVILSGFASPLFKDEQGNEGFGDDVNYIYRLQDSRPVLIDSSLRSDIKGNNHYALCLPRRFWKPVLQHYSDSFACVNEPIPVDPDHFLLAWRHTLLLYDRAAGEYTALQEFAGDIKIFKMGAALYLYEKGKVVYTVGFMGSARVPTMHAVQLPFLLHDAEIYWRTGMAEAILVEKRNGYLLHVRDERFTRELICDSLPNNIYIQNIKYDSASQTAAVASDGDGIFLYQKKLLRTCMERSDNVLARSYSFYSQIEMQPNELWLDLLRKLDVGNDKFSALGATLNFESAFRLKDSLALFHSADYHDHKYDVWSYAFQTKKLTRRFAMGHTESGSFAMTENRLFFACDHGLMELNKLKDSMYFSFAMVGHDTLNIARQLIEIRPGYLVFCGGNSVYGFDVHSKKLDSLVIYHLTHHFNNVTAYKGYCILTQYGVGIWILNGRKAVLLPLDKTKYLRSANGVYIDGDNDAWISADAGVFRISADTLVANYTNPGKDASNYLQCEYFGKEEGMELSELNGGRQGTIIRLKNGQLSFVGINGIVTADIANKPVYSDRTRIVADRIIVDEKEIADSAIYSQMHFSPRTHSLKLFFSLPVWTNPVNIVTEYRLIGLADRWITFDYTKQNYLEFNNLPSGNFELQIRATSTLYRSHPVTFSLSFDIATPWYKTVAFYAILLVLSIISIVGIFRWRLRYLKRHNELLTAQVAKQFEAINEQKFELEQQIVEMEAYQDRLENDYALKNRLISIIGHDIITPLRFMNRAGRTLLTRKENISQATYDETLKTILATGNGLHDMAVNMLQWIKHHHETMEFLLSEFDLRLKIDELIKGIQPMAALKEMTIENNIPAGLTLRQYGDPIKTIVLQLLTNSIKYADEGTVITNARIEAEEVLLFVEDKGPGMPEHMATALAEATGTGGFEAGAENSGHGFGFLIIRDMLEVVHGHLAIKSQLNSGTIVTIRFPVKIS